MKADGVVVTGKTAALNAANNWSYTFQNLPKYNKTNNLEIVYFVKEASVNGYAPAYGNVQNGSQTVTNTINKQESGSAVITIKKLRSGSTIPVAGALFSLSNGMNATTDSNGIATFIIPLTIQGPVQYTLTEVSAPAGYTSSNETWTVTLTRGQTPQITLKENVFQIVWNWLVGIESDVNYKNGILTVYNDYSAEDEYILEGTKTLTGREMKNDEFTFTVKENGLKVATGISKADGKIVFTPIRYTADDVGTHNLVITEDSGILGGVKYSKESFTVQVTVTDNLDGTLKFGTIEPIGGVKFHNDYIPKIAVVKLTAKKNLTGADLKVDQFSFQLKDSKGNVVETVKNSVDGKIAFSDLSFTKAGVFNYTVVEIKGNETNVTYDATEYGVKIIALSLVRQNKTLCLSCFNTTETEVNPEQLKHVFDRFYRTDTSRNSQTGGHGIGLSVAKAIVTAHSGKINAFSRDGHSFQITIVFPI